MTLRELDRVICECYLCIYGYTDKNEEITFFDDNRDDESVLKEVLEKYGENKVRRISAGKDEFIYVEIYVQDD